MSILFENAAVLIREKGPNGVYNVLEGAYLGVEGEKINYIGFDKPENKYDDIRDMTGKLFPPDLLIQVIRNGLRFVYQLHVHF